MAAEPPLAEVAPPADLARLQALARWRADAPTGALAATVDWIGSMP